MNFQFTPTLDPLKVLMINSLTVAAQLTIVKILSGRVFGNDQLIDLIILVYSNEIGLAEALKLELVACGFRCNNSIQISSDLPSITDADVFCITTKFPNPNCIDFTNIDTDDQFDTLYLITKIASNWSFPEKVVEEEKPELPLKSLRKPPPDIIKPRKPIIIADGLVALDIIKSLSTNLPNDILFCPSVIPTIAKNVLAETFKVHDCSVNLDLNIIYCGSKIDLCTPVDHQNKQNRKAPSKPITMGSDNFVGMGAPPRWLDVQMVQCNVINDVYTWAANDNIFHVDFVKPLIVSDRAKDDCHTDAAIISRELMESANLDYTQFSESWLKRELIEKIGLLASKNPYGEMYKAAEFAKTLRAIWKTRSSNVEKSYSNIGVISDGSLDTLKGYPYVLPLVFTNDTWSVNSSFRYDTHRRQEMKRMNKAVKQHHEKLIPYCKKFLNENVINQAFIPSEDSSTHFSMTMGQNSSSSTTDSATV